MEKKKNQTFWPTQYILLKIYILEINLTERVLQMEIIITRGAANNLNKWSFLSGFQNSSGYATVDIMTFVIDNRK